jgi:lysophospholipase
MSEPSTSESQRVQRGPIESTNGTLLHYRHRAPERAARARALVVHGYPEHSGRYVHVLEACAARGIDAWAVDLRGFGEAAGKRGFIEEFDEYLDDVSAFVAHATGEKTDALPAFLIGHSMGGLVCARFMEERPKGIAGLVLTSPFLQLRMKVPVYKKIISRLFSRITPGLVLPTGFDPTTLSRDPEVVFAKNDG